MPPGSYAAGRRPAAYVLGRRLGSVVELDEPGDVGVDGALGGVVGQRRGSATPRRAQRAVVAPVAQPTRAGAPVAGRRGALDGGPEGLDLALGAEQVLLVGLVGDDLAVAEVDELEPLGDRRRAGATARARRTSSGRAPWPRSARTASGPSCSRRRASRRSGRRRAGRRSRAARARRPRSRRRARARPARAGSGPRGRTTSRAGSPRPANHSSVLPSCSASRSSIAGSSLGEALPLLGDEPDRGVEGALGRGQVEEPLEDGVHERAPGRRLGRRRRAACR